MVSSNLSANPDRSSMTPMKTNRGTAIRVTLPMMPHIREGSKLKKFQPKPINPNTKAVPPRVKVTGNPNRIRIDIAKNMYPARYSIALKLPFPFQRPHRSTGADC